MGRLRSLADLYFHGSTVGTMAEGEPMVWHQQPLGGLNIGHALDGDLLLWYKEGSKLLEIPTLARDLRFLGNRPFANSVELWVWQLKFADRPKWSRPPSGHCAG
jgi:hypothetical protein